MRDLIPFDALPPGSAPFKDPNFKLAVMAELIETRVLDFGDFTDFLRFVEGDQYNYEVDGYAPSDRARDYLNRFPLSDYHLQTVKFLEFDGGLVIYEYIYPFWDGENDSFDIASLDDLRHLPNLRRFSVISMLTSTNLDPLRAAPRLERVSLGLTGKWQNLDALLGLPRLTHLSLFKTDLTRRFRDPVLEALKDRGVKVAIFG